MPVATGVSTWLVGTVRAVQQVNEHARVIMVDVPDWPGSMPGQHLDLRLTAEDGYQAVRSYSIASFGPGSLVELAVDEFPDGEVSPYLVREVRAGDLVEIRGPIGRYFVWSPAQTEPVQLIAGGSGIVPLMAIVRAHQTPAPPPRSDCSTPCAAGPMRCTPTSSGRWSTTASRSSGSTPGGRRRRCADGRGGSTRRSSRPT